MSDKEEFKKYTPKDYELNIWKLMERLGISVFGMRNNKDKIFCRELGMNLLNLKAKIRQDILKEIHDTFFSYYCEFNGYAPYKKTLKKITDYLDEEMK